MSKIVKLYRDFIPESFRRVIYNLFLKDLLVFIRESKPRVRGFLAYRFKKFLPQNDKNKLYAFIGEYGLNPLPYEFRFKYDRMDVCIEKDNKLGLPFVVLDNKKLYFPEHYSFSEIKKIFIGLCAEQDPLSPHRYVDTLTDLKGKYLFDIGCAEAIFSLKVIDFVEHAYLFECEERWIEALNATFSPYKDKVTIIRKFVSDKNDQENITLDEFLKDKNIDNIFLKMDIEGAELSALSGAKETLSSSERHIDCAICTYHKENDTTDISHILSEKGFEYEFSEGYIFYNYVLRKCLVKGTK